MRILPVLLTLAVLATASLAGCSGKNKNETGTADGLAQAAQDVNVKATSTTGIIRGIVVDVAIRPVVGVTVSLQTAEKMLYSNTTATGAFGFQDLKPGTYFVKAHKAGFVDQQTSADVKAGVSDPAITKIQLVGDASYRAPYFVVVNFHGFIECGATTPVIAGAVCSFPDIACGTGPAPCNTTNDNFAQFIAVDGGRPMWVQHEIVWDDNQAIGETFNLAGRSATLEQSNDGSYDDDIAGAAGLSPLLLAMNQSLLAKYDVGVNGTGLAPAVFSGGIEGSEVCDPTATFGCLFGTGATVEQEFDMYTHIFYGYTPPEGWRFSADGDPPLPN